MDSFNNNSKKILEFLTWLNTGFFIFHVGKKCYEGKPYKIVKFGFNELRWNEGGKHLSTHNPLKHEINKKKKTSFTLFT